MKVTIKDIAKIANVSHTTVSRALNDSPLINQKTKEEIQRIAEKLNYVPNLSAKGLVKVQSFNIGLFFTSMVNATSADFIYAVIKSVSETIPKPYHVVINGLDVDEHIDIASSNYDGIILVSQMDDDWFIRKVMEAEVPIIVINRKLDTKFPISNIFCDEKRGIQEAVEYLADCGHQMIGFLEGYESSASNIRRKQGFENEMMREGLELKREWVFKGDFSVESGYRIGDDIAKLTERPTAIICASDAMAVGLMRRLIEMKIRIPDDISIIGFDNGTLSNYSTPSLSSIERPIETMAKSASELLINTINGIVREKQIIQFPTNFYPKESVKKIK